MRINIFYLYLRKLGLGVSDQIESKIFCAIFSAIINCFRCFKTAI